MASVAERLAAFAAVVLFAIPARAQPESAAQVLFEEGRRLVAAGDVAAGCAKLAESQRLDPAGGTLLNLAACHERLGKTATAWAEFNDALAQAKRDGRDDRVAETTRRIEALTPRLARLTVTVESAAASLEVKIDGTALGSASWGTAIPIDPGDHDVRASAPGNHPWSSHLTIAPGASQSVVVPPLVRQAAPAASALRAPAEKGAHGREIVEWSAAGIGVVAIGIGTYYGFVALSRKNDSDRACSVSGCTANGLALAREANTSAWASNVGIGVGVASLAVATILLLTTPDSKPQALVVLPGGIGGRW